MIELRTLGTLALRNAGGEDLLSVLAQPKRVALLAYLALARPHGFQRRDTLLALLWPEQDEQHARWALNQALRHLRQALGKEVLPSRGDGEVGIEPGTLWCDAVEFEAAIEADDPGRALELYRGALLEGFHVSGCGEFERWLEEERDWLRRRAAHAATALARRAEAGGEWVAADHWARRACALSPDDEREVRNLIELLGRIGDRAGAVEVYEEFVRRLREEYEVEPAPETQAAIAAVRARRAETPGAATGGLDPPPPGSGEPVAPEPTVLAAPLLARRRRRRWLALGVPALLAGATVVWSLRSSPAVSHRSPLPPTTIAVLPFTYRGSPEFAYLGEGMVDLLSANLDGAGEIRTVDPYAVLALTREAGRDPPGPEEARNVAARLGAGAHVQGHVVETGGRLRISARLYARGSGEGSGEGLVSGPSTQLFALVDGLTAQLIAQQSGGPAGRLSRLAALTTDSLAALKAYLEGERYFRVGQADSSFRALERAVRIDSSFALAHYRLATAVWKFLDWGSPRAKEALDQALRHSHRLSDSDRRLFRALAALLHDRPAEAERRYRDIVSWHPDNVEATYILAEMILHGGRDRELRNSWLDAREWFERVLAIDPGHRHALTHLSHIAARERRLGELDSLAERLDYLRRHPEGRSITPVSPEDWLLRGQRAIVFGDTAGIDRFVARLREGGDEVQPQAGFLVWTTGDLETGRRIWRVFTEPPRTRGMRVLAHVTLAKLEVMTGRWSAAKTELAAAAALDAATALEHRALLSLWPLMRVSRSELLALRDTLLRWKAVAGPFNQTSVSGDHAPAHPYLRLYLLGLLDVRLGGHAAALAGASELEWRAERSFAPAFVRDLARALRAEVARARGSPAGALMILDSLEYWTDQPLDATGNSPFFVHEREHFTRSELLDALGRDSEAIRAYRAIADFLYHSGAPAHFRLAEIYERRGERRKAAEHYARFAELWKDCDPELRPLVEEARRRMGQADRALIPLGSVADLWRHADPVLQPYVQEARGSPERLSAER